jgi:hypothetical protein
MMLQPPPFEHAAPARPKRAVFLDKDGTLVEDVPCADCAACKRSGSRRAWR